LRARNSRFEHNQPPISKHSVYVDDKRLNKSNFFSDPATIAGLQDEKGALWTAAHFSD
jgi:hypothetical protein